MSTTSTVWGDDAMIIRITAAGRLLAMILKSSFRRQGIEFLTPPSFSQQLAYMGRERGYAIPPHVHNPVAREVQLTQETLFIKSGTVRVDFYDSDQIYVESHTVEAGDVVLLAEGGHGFEMLTDAEIIEVKQGPYAGEADKTRFQPVAAEQLRGRR